MLPKNVTPTYFTKLPVSAIQVEFRPWVSVENKKYLISALSKDTLIINNALEEILSACTFNKIELSELPLIDYEYLFIQVKAKSKDEIIELNYTATEERDGVNEIISIELNLLEVEISEIPEKKIFLKEGLGVMMKFPTLADSRKIAEEEDEFAKLYHLIDFVFDKDRIYDRSDFTKEELIEWLKNLMESQIQKISEFVIKLPQLKHQIKFIIPETGKEKTIDLLGLSDFFI